MAVNTTFEMFKQLLDESIQANTSLGTVMQAALRTRVGVLPRLEEVELTSRNVESSVGGVVDEANDVITVPTGSGATIVFDLINFGTPCRIEGTQGAIGALIGHLGGGTNPAVADSDISLQYRASSSDTWKAYDRTTVIESVTTVQFQAIIAVQGADADLPQLHIVAEQL